MVLISDNMIKIRIHLQNRGVFKDGPERRSSHLPYLESLLLLRYKATCPTSPLSPTPPPAELKSWRPCRGAAPNRCHRLASDPVLGLVDAVASESRYLAMVIIMSVICKNTSKDEYEDVDIIGCWSEILRSPLQKLQNGSGQALAWEGVLLGRLL